jgi:hypothetical protein
MLAIKDFENYLLFYLEHEDCVDVIRVLHGARDIPAALPSGCLGSFCQHSSFFSVFATAQAQSPLWQIFVSTKLTGR